jgi:hypothetical protein
MMATVRVRRRAACSSALVGLLVVLAAGAAWLGIAQAPTSGAVLWGTFVADTTAAGTLAFFTTSGPSAAGTVTRGLVDFPAQDEIARTMLGKPGSHLRIELKVVDGTAYQRGLRNGIELGRWRRLPTPVGLVPFTGVALPLLTASPAHLKRLGQIDLRGTMTTEYQVASTTFSCPANRGGEPTFETSVVRAWVDGESRIRQLQSVGFARFGALIFRFDTTTTLTRFGTPVHVTAPAKFSEPPSGLTLHLAPGAGCRVTQR